jgi:hypothetical protein
MRVTDYEKRARPALEWLDRQCEAALEAFQEGRRVMFQAPEAMRYFVDVWYTKFERPRQWAESHPAELEVIVEAYGHRFDPPKSASAPEISAPLQEGYAAVTTPEQHQEYIATRRRIAQLFEAIKEIPLGKLDVDDLEALLDEINVQISLKKGREKAYATMTVAELSDLLNRVQAELEQRRADLAAKKKAETRESAPPPQRGELTDLSGPIDVRVEKRDVRVERL